MCKYSTVMMMMMLVVEILLVYSSSFCCCDPFLRELGWELYSRAKGVIVDDAAAPSAGVSRRDPSKEKGKVEEVKRSKALTKSLDNFCLLRCASPCDALNQAYILEGERDGLRSGKLSCFSLSFVGFRVNSFTLASSGDGAIVHFSTTGWGGVVDAGRNTLLCSKLGAKLIVDVLLSHLSSLSKPLALTSEWLHPWDLNMLVICSLHDVVVHTESFASDGGVIFFQEKTVVSPTSLHVKVSVLTLELPIWVSAVEIMGH
ncbi:hypothetical protein Tco_0740102 [Tanacetum coccineum]